MNFGEAGEPKEFNNVMNVSPNITVESEEPVQTNLLRSEDRPRSVEVKEAVFFLFEFFKHKCDKHFRDSNNDLVQKIRKERNKLAHTPGKELNRCSPEKFRVYLQTLLDAKKLNKDEVTSCWNCWENLEK